MKKIMLKIMSIFFGVSLWYILSQQRNDSITVDVPICFYNTTPQVAINAPETIRISLYAKRSDLIALDFSQLAIHLDAKQLQKPSTNMYLESRHLFLPATIKLVDYSPAPVLIRVTSEEKQA